MMRKDVLAGGEVQVQNIRKNDEKRRFRRFKLKKSYKMMRKDVSGGGFQKFVKLMRKDVSGGGEVNIQKIRKNDEKRRFRRLISKYSKK